MDTFYEALNILQTCNEETVKILQYSQPDPTDQG